MRNATSCRAACEAQRELWGHVRTSGWARVGKRFGATVPLLAVLAVALHAQDGICKKDDVPTDYVAVGEFNSPECDDGANPLAKNAWRVEPVRDGITVCALPKYEVLGAKVAELLACEHVVSEKCNPRLDGLPNAIVLRSPAGCVKRKVPDDLEVKCSASAELTNGATGYMVSQLTSSTCPPAPGSNQPGYVHTSNAWLARKVDSSQPTFLAICADDHNIGRDAYIVRRFKNSNCPVNPRVAGAEEGLTGWIILLNQPFPKEPETLTLCEGFTKDSWKPFGGGWIGYHVAGSHSELCGGQSQKPNSFEVSVGPKDLLFAEASASCLTGVWHEEQDFTVPGPADLGDSNRSDWTFGFNGDQLLISRVTNHGALASVSGSFKKYSVYWSGTLEFTTSTGGHGSGGLSLQTTADCKQTVLKSGSFGFPWELTLFRK
jgi:hypothetical protein